MQDEKSKQMLQKIEEIGFFIKKNADDPAAVRQAADDLHSVLRHGCNVIGSRYGS